jgi:hypothetical protein
MSRTLWRVAPLAHLADAVCKLAMAEGRSDSNMVTRLVSEAGTARQTADRRVNKLVDTVRCIVDADQGTPAMLWLRLGAHLKDTATRSAI